MLSIGVAGLPKLQGITECARTYNQNTMSALLKGQMEVVSPQINSLTHADWAPPEY